MNAAKLKKLEGQVRIGGKGSARRKRKHVQRTSTYDEKRLQTTLQKLSLTSVTGVNSVTLTMNNGNELMMNSPKVQGSVMANMYVFTCDMIDMKVPEKEPESDDDVPLLVSGFDAIEEDNSARKSNHKQTVTKKGLCLSIEKKVKKEHQNDKKKPSSLIDNEQEKKNKDEDKPSEDQLAKNKKKKPKKPRNRVRSRNKKMTAANPNQNAICPNKLDGAGDGQVVIKLKKLDKEPANLADSTDAISNPDSDKTSIFSDSSDMDQTIVSDNESFITVCPDDFNLSETDAEYILDNSEEEMSFRQNAIVDNNGEVCITFNVEEPLKSSPDEDEIVINELN